MFSLRAPRLLLIASVAFAVAACGAAKPEVASVGDREVAEADLDQAAALQHVLAELQGAVCGGQPAEGESADTACDRVALSGELLWLAVAPYAEEHDITAERAPSRRSRRLETQFGADQIERSLEARDLTREDLIALAQKVLTIQAVRVAVAEERIGDDALRSQYEERVSEFTTVNANHILLETRADAQRIYEQVKDATPAHGSSPSRRRSRPNPGLTRAAGALADAPAAQFVPEFASVVAGLEPGEVSAARADAVRLARDLPRGQGGHAVRGREGRPARAARRSGVRRVAGGARR